MPEPGLESTVLLLREIREGDPAARERARERLPFRRAGLRTVIMSLWMVNDRATRDWMKSLYRSRLVDGSDTASAIRSACREQIEARRARGEDTHPFHWAAFVAAGDWR